MESPYDIVASWGLPSTEYNANPWSKQNNQMFQCVSARWEQGELEENLCLCLPYIQTLGRIQQLIIMEMMMPYITCYLSECWNIERIQQYPRIIAIPDGRVLWYDFSISDISRLPEEMSQWLPVRVRVRVADHMSAGRISSDRHITILHPHSSALVYMG
jgi:hypothetical protein